MIPGTSRSGATIIGALLLGVSRPLATEFSFYLAIPTMFGATLLKLLKGGITYTKQEWYYLGIGTFIAFLVAYIVISWFMKDRKSTRLNSSHANISYAVFCLKKKKKLKLCNIIS